MTQGRSPDVQMALATGDLGTISAAFARAFGRVEAYRASLREKDSEQDPIGDARPLAGQKAFEALSQLLANDPLAREGARRATAALTLFRIGAPLERALFVELGALRSLEYPTGAESSFAASVAALACEKEARARAAHLALLCAGAQDVSAPQRELLAIRHEVCARLGVGHPMAFAAESSVEELTRVAESFLQRTDGLWKDVLGRQKKRAPDATWTALSGVGLARADEASVGWPARVSREWLMDVVPALRDRAIAPSRSVKIVGAASFTRVLYTYGAELRRRGAPRSLPFYVAQDPWPRAAYELGFLLGALPCSAAFHHRALGLSSGAAKDQALIMTASALVSLRWSCARVLLALGAQQGSDGADRFTELTLAVFGAPFPEELFGAWPTARLSDGARLLAAMDAAVWSGTMVERFDDDWFANPHAGRAIKNRITGPMREVRAPDTKTPSAVDNAERLARMLEAAFG